MEKYKEKREITEKNIKNNFIIKSTPVESNNNKIPKDFPTLEELKSDLDNLEASEIEKNIKKEAEINTLNKKDDDSNNVLKELDDICANLLSYEDDVNDILNQMN